MNFYENFQLILTLWRKFYLYLKEVYIKFLETIENLNSSFTIFYQVKIYIKQSYRLLQ